MNVSMRGHGSQSSAEKQPVSVLDELENYWQEQDAIIVKSDKFGILAKQAEDMMLQSSSGKKAKRAGAFCIGI